MTDHPRSVWPLVAAGFVALGVPAVLLVALGVLGAILHAGSVTLGALLLLVAAGTVQGLRFEWRAVLRTTDVKSMRVGEIARTVAAILWGTLLTLVVTVELDVSSIVSAGLVGIVAALIVPKHAVPVYCGAFVGMTSPELFTTYWHALLAGGFASVVFVLVLPVFHGIGGKLGTTAFVGATFAVLTTTGTFHSEPLPGAVTVVLVVGYSIVGAVTTFSIHTRLPCGPVFASGVVGIVGGLFLPLVHAGPGELVAAAVFAASFAGMTEEERIPDERWMVLSGAAVGLVVVYTIPYFGGSGGKLGTIAFASCLAVYGLLGTFHLVRVRHRLRKLPQRDVT